MNGDHIVEIDCTPFAAVNFKKVNLTFHVQMLWLGRSKRSIIVKVIDRKDDADKRTDRFAVHGIGDARVALSQIVAVFGVHHIKRKAHTDLHIERAGPQGPALRFFSSHLW